eukprot:scaffold266193_cov40-Tisochrysis_lutea.AAC.3
MTLASGSNGRSGGGGEGGGDIGGDIGLSPPSQKPNQRLRTSLSCTSSVAFRAEPSSSSVRRVGRCMATLSIATVRTS